MKAVVQRVRKASLMVDDKLISTIGEGLVCYLGVGRNDTDQDLSWLMRKVTGLRIFPDSEGKMNLSLLDCGYEILVVSQFTLFGNVRKGFRPSFIEAEEPELAREMYDRFCAELEILRPGKIAKGVFAADMLIEQTNYGPVTILLDSRQT
ncbi:MAG: D-tyrosyl-tRNA(Tyr) deacylase [Candidatus Riflebacteria bacterium]|nr:D-tyrosyl-tRNA(Tyr) deacylase [Candidatus Riflebacteria bacterium]